MTAVMKWKQEIKLRMLCSCGDYDEARDSGPIINLDKLLMDYAWKELKRDARWYEDPLLRRSDYNIEIPWNFYEFEHKTVRFVPRQYPGCSSHGFKEKKQVELFSTDYKNNTSKEQLYNLKTQRQTLATTYISFQRGFTVNNEANFKLEIPEYIGHCGVTASADGHLRVTKWQGETFHEYLTWQVDSDITVDPFHVTNVKLVVTEDEFVADFEVKSTLLMPTGEAPIIVKRKRDNHIHAVLLLSDLSEVFSEIAYPGIKLIKTIDEYMKSNYIIELSTVGSLESVRWRDQRIYIESNPIGSSETEPSECHYDVPIYSKDIYSRVIKHATKDTPQIPNNDSGTSLAFKHDVTAHKPDVSAHKPDVSAYKPDISAHKPEGTAYKHDLPAYKSDVASYKHEVPAYKPDVTTHKFDITVCKSDAKEKKVSVIPTIITEKADDTYAITKPKEKEKEKDKGELATIAHPPLRHAPKLHETQKDKKVIEDIPPFYKSTSFDMPLQPIRELSLEDKQKSSEDDAETVGTPDSSDSKKFSKVTSV
ncbi:hypothetical protein KUTeg_012461 [Tegillarca granosa]|uniref:Uncharacterized protein n=1 Tax=Tegillarca granosa TaxID=220873 RepID=A0ABQ9EZL8_TEGGR|nr:hypothetical protein KUTeg_012461 [Tegillarca granosa]